MRRAGVGLLALSSLALLVGYASAWWPSVAPRGVALLFAAATVLQLVAFVLLGARRRDGRLGAGWMAVVVLVALVGGILITTAAQPGSAEGEALLLGLPRRAAFVLYGVGIAPLLLLAGAFARGFAAWSATDADVARLRALRPPSDA